MCPLHRDPKLQALLEGRAHAMREAASWSERLLWRELRAERVGTRFVRQAVVGRAIVDFLAQQAMLVVEVDGGWHSRRAGADARRDRKLRRRGYRVLRLEAALVERDVEAAVRLVREALEGR